MFVYFELVLQISHNEDDPFLTGFTFDEIDKIFQPELASPFDLFGVSAIEVAVEIQTALALEFSKNAMVVDDLFEGIVNLVEKAFDFVDPSLSFDVLSGFVFLSNDVHDSSFMDLSIFKYLSVPYDEIVQHDSDDDSSSASNSGPIDQKVSPATRDTNVVDFGQSYLDLFVWSYEDMSSLNLSIVQHRLPLLPHAKLVKQKLRQLHPLVEYPKWLANVTLVPKNDGNVRVCVDFRDFNKVSPKDDFPLPHIDMLIDSTIGHSMLSFMDKFFGYNQILMALENMEKTSFITKWGTYYCIVMPFGLKNTGTTYQRAIATLFHDMMHQDVEFRLRLNPNKCTFRVTSGKLLGYMVSERVIEADLDKIRAIFDMPIPRTEREIRGFLGRLQYISRFIAKLTHICVPIFRLLRKSQPTVWDDQCQRAFERIREYLLSPPVLVSPTPGRPLLLYLAIDDDFPDEDVAIVTSLLGWHMYFDGVANHSGYGISVFVDIPSWRPHS
ncbi:Transposon Ty3-I Gag-Pol polyprotein [Vitis vinifera]|uniref:Transposon Ty3-I Gag-Pol polyprotein n=1 Tax=Vitis vinifera TaxID=29760 RepID=A0A438F9U7_VITVI|nr:Transposon Ty3-I Gag-Pol polyprotein [Vitis vinifera]